MSRPHVWASKIVTLIQGGNTQAALAQIKVAPSVTDVEQLRTLLTNNLKDWQRKFGAAKKRSLRRERIKAANSRGVWNCMEATYQSWCSATI